MSISRERVLAALKAHGDRSMHTMEVVLAVGADKKQGSEVRETLDSLRSLGLVKELPGNRWKHMERKPGVPGPLPKSDRVAQAKTGVALAEARVEQVRVRMLEDTEAEIPGTRVGWFALTGRGFGFVVSDEGHEVFIPPNAAGLAYHRDRVRVRTTKSPKGEEGEIIAVVQRGLLRVAGMLMKGRDGYEIHPGDPRLPNFFRVEGELPLEARAGLEVVGQITHYPTRYGDFPVVRVIRVIGPRGTAAVEVEKVRIRDGVAEEFPEEVVQEALAFPATVDADELNRREDLRAIPLLTIDPKDARDHDDAVWAERLADGGFRIIVAIADVSFYVRTGTAIDKEALARGCSIYLPDRAIPMLPPELSSNLASLLPHEDRLMLGMEAEVSKGGVVRSYRFIEGAMRSAGRLTYEKVARTLGLTEAGELDPEAEKHKRLLQTLLEASKALRARRNKRGALGFELPEPRVLLDEQGEPRDVVVSKSDAGVKRAYELIEDLMLLANETVAEHLTKNALPGIFRVHGRPDDRKLEQFSAVAQSFGYNLGPVDDLGPKELAGFLKSIEGTPLEGPLGMMLLRSMQQATYQVDDIGHFALAARHYLHFTSPIRRYPDLAVHRILRALAQKEEFERDNLRRKLVPQAVQSSRMERRAMMIEREVQAIYRVILMKKRVGEELPGKVTGVQEHGLNVTLNSPYVETRIPIERVGEDFFELDRLGIALVGQRSGRRIALGDEVMVRVDEASMERREIYCTLLGGGSRRSSNRLERAEAAGGYEAPRRSRPGSTSARPPHSKAIIAEASASLPEEKGRRSSFKPAKAKSKSSKPKASKTRTAKADKGKPSRAERKSQVSPGKKPKKRER